MLSRVIGGYIYFSHQISSVNLWNNILCLIVTKETKGHRIRPWDTSHPTTFPNQDASIRDHLQASCRALLCSWFAHSQQLDYQVQHQTKKGGIQLPEHRITWKSAHPDFLNTLADGNTIAQTQLEKYCHTKVPNVLWMTRPYCQRAAPVFLCGKTNPEEAYYTWNNIHGNTNEVSNQTDYNYRA